MIEQLTPNVVASVGTLVTALLAILGFLGVGRYLIEPELQARDLKKKYATALWISCNELRRHLKRIEAQIKGNETDSINSLRKLPDKNFNGAADWFTKEGYYASITAYKISVVSSWLQIYKQELLFSTVRRSRSFFGVLYARGEHLKSSFSEGTEFWPDYFDAIGCKLIDIKSTPPRPLDFAKFCECYFENLQFRKFYDQLHMFIWFIADGKNLPHVEKARDALLQLMRFLEAQNLLPGLKTEIEA
jgi:hypothetical protein